MIFYNLFHTLSRHDSLPLSILKELLKPSKLEVKLPHGDLTFFFLGMKLWSC